MLSKHQLCRVPQLSLCLLRLALLATLASNLTHAQVLPQVTQPVDPSVVTHLKNSVHPMVRNGAVDMGAVPDTTPTGRITVLLKRPVAQEQALRQFLSDVHRKGSPLYHQWLTPSRFGEQFGLADSDVSAVTAWLESQGLKIESVSSSKHAIQFSGTAGQVGAAFHTSLHAYSVNGETHHSNSSELQIPTVLAPVIEAIGPLNDFHAQPQSHLLGTANLNPKTHQITPQFTFLVPYDLGLAPEDLATQYDIKPLYSAGVTGAGKTIGIINESNIDLGLVAAYRKLFNLDADPSHPNLPTVVIDGDDPGINGAALEAYLDVEIAGAIAPQAHVVLYTSAGGEYDEGITLAAMRAVEDDTADVLSLSFGGCEALDVGFSDPVYNQIWEQAAAQGQTVMVSSGDAAAAGCDVSGSLYAELGRQVNGLGSSPWNVSVGGSDFYYPGGISSVSSFWSQTNDSNYGSLLQPLPEQPWDSNRYGENWGAYNNVLGGGGGQSACAIPGSGADPLTGFTINTGNGPYLFDCAQYTGYPKPAWQSGPGVPSDGVRDVPDISLFASTGDNGSFYVICYSPGDCTNQVPGSSLIQASGVGGTSASSPAFAGIMALVNQKYGRQGQANTVLYPLAQQVPAAFHDITVGSNNVPCDPSLQFSIECVPDASGGTYSIGGWNATPGYDLASGLGSVDVTQLVTNWNKVTFQGSRTNLSASSTDFTHGQPVTLHTDVLRTSGSGTPTGNVALVTSLAQYASTGLGTIALDSTGNGSLTTSQLPGGNYTLTAQYGGDATFSGSQSAPVSFTIRPERSLIHPTTDALALTYPNGPTSAPVLKDLGPITNGATYPYGTVFTIDLQVTGATEAAATVSGAATGSITLLDHHSVLSTNSLDTTGNSIYQTLQLPVGVHRLSFFYSGDSSYLPTSESSPDSPLTFTVAQAPTTTLRYSATGSPIRVGGTFSTSVAVFGTGGAPPTGTVTFTLGNLPPQTVQLTAQIGFFFEQGSGASYAAAVYSNLPAGTYTLNATYSGDANWQSSSSTSYTVTVAGTSSLLPSISALTITSSAGSGPILPSTILTLTATVSGGPGATLPPSGLVGLEDEGYPFKLLFLTPSASGATSTASFTLLASQLLGGANQLWVIYLGDANYQSSFSQPVNYTDHTGDFTLVNTTQTLALSDDQTGVAFLQLQGLNQFSGPVKLSCAVTGGPAGNTVTPTCTVPPVAIVQSAHPSTSIVRVSAARNSNDSPGDSRPIPAGTYTAVITANSGTVSHDVALTVAVQKQDR